jgi:2-desacetyl-2-hydroxyethyl bacteriochlorophyllide A dehydrogenase
MRAIVVNKPEDMQLVNRNEPGHPGFGEVKVKIHVTGICGSDVGVWHGKNPYAVYPVVIGHEASGEIVEVGEGVTDKKVGDTVVFEPIRYCGKCYACRTGNHNVCRQLKVLGCIDDGTFQDFKICPATQVYRYDSNKMTFREAALCEPYTIGLQANSRGNVMKGDVVLVHGAGPIGLIVADIAKERGATVIISEPVNERLELAKKFGIDYQINPMEQDLDAFINNITDGEGVNVVFDAAGVPAIIQHAIDLLSPAGRFVPMTYGKTPIPIDFQKINAKQLTILGTRHQYQKFPEVVGLLPKKLDHVHLLTTHIFSAENYMDAFNTLADKSSGACKVLIEFNN